MDRPGKFSIPFLMACRSGYEDLASQAQEKLKSAITDCQRDDGLFRGRGPQGDLYYTWFSLILAQISQAPIDFSHCSSALRKIPFSGLDLVHSSIWLRSIGLSDDEFAGPDTAFPDHISSLAPEAFPQSDPCSPYARFIMTTLKEDFGLQIDVRRELADYRLPSGLYSNLPQGTEYGTNATASALFCIDDEQRLTTVRALARLQREDGSFSAAEQSPVPDLLSTGTALFALSQFGAGHLRSPKPFLRECYRDNGLFGATGDDPLGDVEYTVYGLVALGAFLQQPRFATGPESLSKQASSLPAEVSNEKGVADVD